MAERRQLPPQIKRVELAQRAGGRPVVRYQLTVDVGWVDGKRKKFRKRYATEKGARDKLDEIRGAKTQGTYVHTSTLTVDKACENWLASLRLEETSVSGYEWILRPVRSEFGELPVQKLTRRQVDDLVNALQAGGTKSETTRALKDGRTKTTVRTRRPWGARSCNYMLGTLSQVLDQLVTDGVLVRNVVAHVDRVPGKAQKFKTYTTEQVDTAIKSFAKKQDRNRHAWRLGLTGARRGEIGGLRWPDVDFDAEAVTIWRTRVSAGGRTVEKESAKSDDSERKLPIPAPLLTELKAAKARQAAEKLAIGAAYNDQGYVVCNEAGEPYHPDTLSKMWAKAIKAAGVPHIRLQDARHTCGTLMHHDGVPAAIISAWLGHADVAFTMRTYVHSQPELLSEGAQSLARITPVQSI